MAGLVLTVVVVTWNAADLLVRCLSALEEQTLDRAAYEMVVIDNASVDGTGELLAGWLTPADGPRPSPDVFRFCNEHNRLITLAKKAPLHPMATVALRHPMMSAVRLAGGTTQRRIARVRLRAYADFLRRLPEVSRQRRSMPSPMRARRREVAKLLVSGRARPS
jgi:glycosyltransferase involved in cell wall biosynthesis